MSDTASIFQYQPQILRETCEGIQRLDLRDQMLANREVELCGPVDAGSCAVLIRSLLHLQQEDAQAPIRMFINSPGGEVQSGLALYDVMQALNCPVNTICLGMAASMAALIFVSGARREMLPHSRIMIHDPLIGGGIGVPPMLGCVRTAVDKGAQPAAILGFRNQGAVILEGDFRDECETFVTTDDGTYARHGFVTDVLKEQVAGATGVAACGPKPMLKAIAAIAKEVGVPCQVSMEERMGCGIGACLVCACALKSENGETRYGHVCKDGPVFNAEEVEW